MPHRALIVDDSRSARVVLTRMLESFGLTVDTVESAEQALTYLQTHRPDVIFMDHLMPGMDGFAAVRLLKANPETAAIPVLMYTSQEGEMYLSQARALGALGVLPKTLKSADVAAVLQQLKLDARAATTLPEVVIDAAPDMVSAPPSLSVTASAQLAHRIATELSAELPALQHDIHHSLRRWRLLALSLAVLLLVGVGAAGYLLQQTRAQLLQVQALQQQLLSVTAAEPLATTTVAAAPDRATAVMATSAAPTVGSASAASLASVNAVATAVEPYAYGEVPLSGSRLERLRALVNELKSTAQQASIRVQVWSADFCLSANASGYELAAADTLLSRCEALGNPFAEALSVQQRQSVAFASWLASVNHKDGITIQIQDAGHQPWSSYPERLDSVTADTWNSAASRYQRVEFFVSVHGS